MRWNLDVLYKSFDDEKFKTDLENLPEIMEKYNKYCSENFPENSIPKDDAWQLVEGLIELELKLAANVTPLMRYCSLVMSANAYNTDAIKYQEKVGKLLISTRKYDLLFGKWIAKVDNLDKLCEKSELIKEHKYHLLGIQKNAKRALSDEEEILYAKLKQTGSSSWNKLKELVVSSQSATVKIDGEKKEVPLSQVVNYLFNKDQKIRKSAFEAYQKACEPIAETVAAALNSIKGEVLTISEAKGYESVLEKTLEDSFMKKKSLDAMLEAIKESLPKFKEYFLKKAEILGHKNGLPMYDIAAPTVESDMNYTFEEAQNTVIDNFANYSDELANYAKRAFDENWIDSEPRKGKRGGAFCAGLSSVNESRILANFSGSFKNVITLAHELGHGFHNHCLRENSLLNRNYPMPLAETASIFCETIVYESFLERLTGKERLAALDSRLFGSSTIVVDIYSRYLFETELFEKRKDSAVSLDELKDMMTRAQKEAFGGAIDPEYMNPYAWLNKPHYYYSERNFYNFPYTFGQLFALGLYSVYQEDKEAFKSKYNDLLAATTMMDVESVAKLMDIDITKKEFWQKSLKLILSDIDEFMKAI